MNNSSAQRSFKWVAICPQVPQGVLTLSQLVELVLAELDAPLVVRTVGAAIEAFNQKHADGASMAG